jgi:pseudouridine-5'-phosphate glycosidase
MLHGLPNWLKAHPNVAAALAADKPIVALESTVITHGLPRPVNLELACHMQSEVASAGAQPATIALLRGTIHVGLAHEALETIALAPDTQKISRRDIGIARAKKITGGTTVAATMYIAHAAGIRVFATGGIGGVHRGEAGDVSADLPELARTPVAVVCSGAKSILDLPRTLEWLETAGVPVIGWGTDEYPAFFSHTSGLPVTVRIDTPQEAAEILRTHWEMGMESGVLICVPCPEDDAVPNEIIEEALARALQEAEEEGIHGKGVTPFLLTRVSALSSGATLRANLALLRNNARVGAEIAKALGAVP